MPENPILALIAQGHRLAEELDATLAPYELTLARFAALDAIDTAPEPLTQRALGRALGRSSGCIVSIVDTLVRAQFVKREGDPADRRVHLLRLQPRGRAAVALARPVLEQRCAQLVGADGEALLAALRRVQG